MKKIRKYEPAKIEKKWQKSWDKNKVYKTLYAKEALAKKKEPFYALSMFPYPSGAGLHVGHPRGYIATDVLARMKRMQGFNVLHPMGYDAFGLPAEQFAIAHKIHPKVAVEKNITVFEKQLSIVGLSYDWSRKVNTTDPEYYKFTQEIFLGLYNHYYNTVEMRARPIDNLIKFFEKNGNEGVSAYTNQNPKKFSKNDWKNFDSLTKQEILMNYRLAYEGNAEVNWCEKLGTVLANDEIVDSSNGPVSERGGYPVEKIHIKQWFLRITAYAERLLNGLTELKWSDHLKEIQKNWIGKSEGSIIKFKILDNSDGVNDNNGAKDKDGTKDIYQEKTNIEVYTTRADTLFGVSYVVLAPEHKLLKYLLGKVKNPNEVEEYINASAKKSFVDRTDDTKEKTGIALDGLMAINPVNNEEVPIWISDYVLNDYGTGAVMAVPAHDKRDYEFAKKYNLHIREVIKNTKDIKVNSVLPYIEDGILHNSSKFNNQTSIEARKNITEFVEGDFSIKYKMRDAIFARQRYWGEPIPLYRDRDGIIHEVKKLPLVLPNVKSYEPTGKAEGPLAGVKSWTIKGLETNTMPGWAGSSWYYLRYMDPKNKKSIASVEEINYWKNVNTYVGGAEHATGHLLYSRFWNKFLFDIGIVITEEPFPELHNQGMILGTDNRKMSKSWGNVVNPDEIVKNYGADSLRVFEMFLGPFYSQLPWSTESIIGSRRFLDKVWKISERILERQNKKGSENETENRIKNKKEVEDEIKNINENKNNYEKIIHKTIKKVTEDIVGFNFNTAISSMMIAVNEIEKAENISIEDFKMLLQILAPFAPHITDEIWEMLGEKKSIHLSAWPNYEPALIVDDSVTIIVQVNGKTRGTIDMAVNTEQSEIENMVKLYPDISKYLENKTVVKIIHVPNRLINFVIKD